MSVVEVLHRLRAQVNAQLLQLAGFAVLESEHVQNPDESVRGMTDCVVQDSHGLGTLLGSRRSDGGGVMGGHLVLVDGLVGVGAHSAGEGSDGALQAIGASDNGGDRAAVQGLGKGVPGGVALQEQKDRERE